MDRFFSKEKIFESVFGYERESDSSAITEHVKNIRAKFARYGKKNIQTVVGDRVQVGVRTKELFQGISVRFCLVFYLQEQQLYWFWEWLSRF